MANPGDHSAARADPNTPRVGFTLPSVGMDRDTWGTLTNGNWTLADTEIGNLTDVVAALNSIVQGIQSSILNYVETVGSIKVWATNAPPSGWLACDGLTVSRADFADLFAVIGTSWGAGDGTTTFQIPNLQGAVPVHRGGWMPFGGSQGETSHQLTWNEMPAHSHAGATDAVGDHTHSYGAVRQTGAPNVQLGAGGNIADVGNTTGAAGGHAHNFATSSAGASWGHNIVQPSVGMLIIIKALHLGF